MNLSREAILGHVAKPLGDVDVPEFGGKVYIAGFSAEEADQLATLGKDGVPSSVRLVILGACDQDGARLFTAEDAPVLVKQPSRPLTAIANAVLALNGLTGAAADEAKNDSSETESADSASASPSPSEEP